MHFATNSQIFTAVFLLLFFSAGMIDAKGRNLALCFERLGENVTKSD
jgi:hypothetical protein